MALKKISFFKSEETGFLLFTPLEKIKEKKLIWGGGSFDVRHAKLTAQFVSRFIRHPNLSYKQNVADEYKEARKPRREGDVNVNNFGV